MDATTPPLGQFLIASGAMTPAQVIECLEHQDRSRRARRTAPRIGALALDRGYLRVPDLEDALRQQSRRAVAHAGPAREEEPAGDLAQEFKILRRLGGDSSSLVCLARHERTGARVSLRISAAGSRTSESAEEDALLRRIRSALTLRHRGIQPAVAGGQCESGTFFAAEFVEGASLRRLIEEGGPLPWRWCWEMAVSLASALRFLHQREMLHLEIRPSNVLVTRQGAALLSGFGSAAHTLKNSRWLLESRGPVPLYLAPEQRDPTGPVSAQTDLYSLGAALYHAVTGAAPLTVRSVAELQKSKGVAEPPNAADLIPDVPGPFARVLERLLSTRASQRFASASELESELARIGPRAARSDGGPGEWHERVQACLSSEPAAPSAPSPKPAPVAVSRRKGGGARLLRENLPTAAIALILIVSITFLFRSSFAYRIFLNRGEDLYVQGDRRGALAKFLQSQALRPDYPEVDERILSLALEVRDYPLAGRQAEIMGRRMPSRRKELQLLAADLEMWGGRFESALQGYHRFVEEHGDGLEARLRVAHAQAACKNLEPALAGFQALHRDFPEDDRPLLEMARLSAALGRHEDSLKFYVSALRAQGESEPVLEEYAHALEACHAFAAAARIYDRLSAFPRGNRLERTLARARCLFWHGDFDGARRALLPLARETSAPLEARALLARTHEALQERELSEGAWKELVYHFPERLDFSLELAGLYERWGKGDRAIVHLRSALRSFGALPEVTSFLARLHAARGDLVDAADFYRQKVRAAPSDIDDRIQLARMLEGSGRLEEGLNALESAPDPAKSSPRLDAERARLSARMNRKSEALNLVRRLEAGSRSDPGLLKTISEIEIQAAEPGQARLFESYLADRPEDVPARRRFAQLLRASGDHGRAWPFYRKLSEEDSESVPLLLEASEEACWAGDPESGLRLLEQLRKVLKSSTSGVRVTAPAPEEIVRRQIAAAFQARRYSRAEEHFVELRALGAAFSTEDGLQRSKALELSGRPAEAFDLLAPLLRAHPDRVDLHAQAAQLAVQLKRFEPAARHFARLSELETEEPRWPVARIQALLRSGDAAGAEAVLQDLSARHPEWKSREIEEAEVELTLKKGNYSAAARLLEEARDSGLRTRTVERDWIRATALAGDAAKVRPDLDRLRKERPKDPDVLVLSGDVAFAERRYAEAVRFYKEALLHGDADRETRLRLARAFAQGGRTREAADAYEALFRENPADPEPLRDKARLLAWKGKPRSSLREYDRLISHFPDRPAIRMEREAKAALFAGDPETAQTAYEALLRAEPGNSHALYDLAEMQRQDDRWDEARRTYRSIQEAEPANPDAREGLRRLETKREAFESTLASSYLEEESRERKTDVRRISYGVGFGRWLSDHFKARGSVDHEDYRFRNSPAIDAYRAMAYVDYADRPEWTGSLGIGYRQYSLDIQDEVLLDGRVGYRISGGIRLEAFIRRDEFTRSVGTIFEELYLTQEGLNVGYDAGPGLEFGATASFGTLTDGNQIQSAEGRARYLLLEGESPVHASYRFHWEGFGREVDLYFSPRSLIQQGVGLSWRMALGGADPRSRFIEPGYELTFDSNGQTGHLLSLGFRYALWTSVEVGTDIKATRGTVYDDARGTVFLSLSF